MFNPKIVVVRIWSKYLGPRILVNLCELVVKPGFEFFEARQSMQGASGRTTGVDKHCCIAGCHDLEQLFSKGIRI